MMYQSDTDLILLSSRLSLALTGPAISTKGDTDFEQDYVLVQIKPGDPKKVNAPTSLWNDRSRSGQPSHSWFLIISINLQEGT
jgi:hypothetical protein